MGKSETIVNISTIFNRGNSTEEEAQAFFLDKKHDELLQLFAQYVESVPNFVGNPKITLSQALNDHGVDVILEFPDTTKIGLQIKSPGDVESKDFAPKVKAQMSESQVHGLDKWYLFICSPIRNDKNDYSMKIATIINELSSYKTSYHVVYNPQQACNILSQPEMSKEEFEKIRRQFISEPVDWNKLDSEILEDKAVSHFLNREKPAANIESKTGELYSNYLGLEEEDEIASVCDDLLQLRTNLNKIPRVTREFLYEVLVNAKKQDRRNQNVLVLAKEMEHRLGISKHQLKTEVTILENNGFAEFDNEQDDAEWYIAIRRGHPDYNILASIRDFTNKCQKPLEQILIDLDFSHLDA